jgi:hypothetical protein
MWCSKLPAIDFFLYEVPDEITIENFSVMLAELKNKDLIYRYEKPIQAKQSLPTGETVTSMSSEVYVSSPIRLRNTMWTEYGSEGIIKRLKRLRIEINTDYLPNKRVIEIYGFGLDENIVQRIASEIKAQKVRFNLLRNLDDIVREGIFTSAYFTGPRFKKWERILIDSYDDLRRIDVFRNLMEDAKIIGGKLNAIFFTLPERFNSLPIILSSNGKITFRIPGPPEKELTQGEVGLLKSVCKWAISSIPREK